MRQTIILFRGGSGGKHVVAESPAILAPSSGEASDG